MQSCEVQMKNPERWKQGCERWSAARVAEGEGKGNEMLVRLNVNTMEGE